jgi:hypothetical protein
VVDRVWGVRKLRLLVVSLCAAALFGGALGWPASGAIVTSLDECRRAGGHESGKYCSGGALNGAVIREFKLLELGPRWTTPAEGQGKACDKYNKVGKVKRHRPKKCR